ncbi:hypothetical protein [Candidatus Williamhamiltonella defendens]|nr:hypothetical protein [Candidatus Hamiltonella defensa]
MSVLNRSYVHIMVRRSGGTLGFAGFFRAGMSTLLRLTTLFDIRV